jgi:hypothetical protein
MIAALLISNAMVDYKPDGVMSKVDDRIAGVSYPFMCMIDINILPLQLDRLPFDKVGNPSW